MANRPIQSIKYPGLSYTYTFTQVDPTLTQPGQAADAKVTGDKIEGIKSDVNTFAETQILPVPYVLESGGINSSGAEITSDTQMRFKDYVPTSEAANIVFNARSTSSNYSLFANYYNLVNGEYVFQSPRISTTGGYEIDTSYEYVRLSFYRASAAGGADEALFRSWISWGNDATAKRFESIESQLSSFITCTENGYDIELGKALYNFRRVTDAGINVDTWRLYRGAIISESELVMWENSDAEGVVKLVGESDYIGGFHGDERYTNAVIYIDGQPATVGTAFARRGFKTLDIFVESALYNAGTTEPDENSHVFNRFKYLHFEGHKVTISNRFTAVQNVKVLQAPLMLVQCNKNDSSGNLCFTNYTVDSDYRVFSTNSADVAPDRSNIAAQSTFITKNGTITARAEQIDPNYSNYYRCDTATYFLTSQNRLKVYFNTIREVSAGIDVTAGNSILARFSITID